jgi:hypothetical protein
MFSPLTTQPWVVDKFSGGITDNYLSAPKHKYQRADNFLITDDEKLITRPGSELVSTTNYLPGYTSTNPRIGALFDFKDQIFESVGRNLYYNNSGYAELVGPSSNPALAAGTSASRASWAFWNDHLLLTNDAFGNPMKLYKDSGGTFRVRNAGLPALATAPTVTGGITQILAFANQVKARYETHRADATAHGGGADGTNTISASDATNLSSLITLVTELLTDYQAHEKDTEKSASWSFHIAEEDTDHSLVSTTAPTTLDECWTALLDLKSKLNGHIVDRRTHGGLTALITASSEASRNYLYRLVYYYSYTVGTVTFEDYGPTYEVEASNIDAPNTTAVAIASIPVLANGSTENYDTSNIKVKIFRTLDSGLSFYYVGQVTNGTTTYNDSTSDATLEDSTLLYTEGGVYDNDPPPKCKYIIVANNIAWYLHTKNASGEIFPNRIRQSVQYDIDACPESFYRDLEDEIVGGGAIGIYPIIFCKSRIYRLEGFYDLTGRGVIDAREISRTVGCVNHLGIVQARDGIFFPGNDGFYFTNGYEVQKISNDFNRTYKDLVSTSTQRSNIYGMFEGLKNRVWWAVQVDSGSADNDACYVADLNFGIRPDTPFTTLSGDESFAPTALLYYNKTVYRGDRRGYLFQHDDEVLTDPEVNTLAAPSTWNTQTIIYDYKSVGFDFGNPHVRKWVPKMTVNAKNASNVSIGINSYNDDSALGLDLKEIRIYSNILWGDPTLIWGDDDLIWNYTKIINGMRRFPATKLRCSYKQIQFTNSFTIVTNSDTLGVATVNSATKKVTLEVANRIWPEDIVGYFITFDDDAYTLQYEVTARDSDTVITFSDALNTSVSGSATAWLLKGYRKGDVFNPLNYTIQYALLSDTQTRWHADQAGENA